MVRRSGAIGCPRPFYFDQEVSMDRLPYHFTSASGDTITFEFKLHPETGSATRVFQLLDVLLQTISREVTILGDTRNGDLLQAMAMAMAVRVELIPGESELTRDLARQVLEQALQSLQNARRATPQIGHA